MRPAWRRGSAAATTMWRALRTLVIPPGRHQLVFKVLNAAAGGLPLSLPCGRHRLARGPPSLGEAAAAFLARRDP
jgi:hypothetical protein